MILYVGLTGPLGSGKSSVADILSTLAHELDIKTLRFSLSDVIRQEVNRRGTRLTRENLKQVAHDYRSKWGKGVWAKLIIKEIKEKLGVIEHEDTLVFIDAIRNPGEVRVLRAEFGSRFKLIGVTAPPEIIRENLRRRRRHDESEDALKDEKFLQSLIEAEMGSQEPSYGHDVTTCLEMADWPPIWNDGSLSKFEEKVRTLAEQKIFPLLKGMTPNLLPPMNR